MECPKIRTGLRSAESSSFPADRTQSEPMYQQVSHDYLWCVLRAKFCLQRASGGNYPAIIESELAKIFMPVPDKEMQNVIAAEVSHRREDARRLRAEAEAGWEGAKG